MLTTIFSKWAWHGRPPELGQHLAHQDMGQGVLLRTPRQGAHGVRVHPPEVLPHPLTAVHCVWILRASRYDASSLVKYLKQAQRPHYPVGPLNVIILRKS